VTGKTSGRFAAQLDDRFVSFDDGHRFACGHLVARLFEPLRHEHVLSGHARGGDEDLLH
jgi:hypothetical protein